MRKYLAFTEEELEDVCVTHCTGYDTDDEKVNVDWVRENLEPFYIYELKKVYRPKHQEELKGVEVKYV